MKNGTSKSTSTENNARAFSPYFSQSASKLATSKKFDWTDLGYPPRKKYGNAMLLPIPLAEGANIITDAYLLNTIPFKNILVDQAAAVSQQELILLGAKSATTRSSAVVVKFGPYEVVLAQSPMAAYDVLGMVSDEKRPQLDEQQLAAFELWYPGWSLAVACFNNAEVQEAAPIAIVGPTRHPQHLFLPAVHGHDGGIPNLEELVKDDAAFIAGSCLTQAGRGNEVQYGDLIEPDIKALLPDWVVGAESRGNEVLNGDLLIKLSDVYAGHWFPERLKPPGAPD